MAKLTRKTSTASLKKEASNMREKGVKENRIGQYQARDISSSAIDVMYSSSPIYTTSTNASFVQINNQLAEMNAQALVKIAKTTADLYRTRISYYTSREEIVAQDLAVLLGMPSKDVDKDKVLEEFNKRNTKLVNGKNATIPAELVMYSIIAHKLEKKSESSDNFIENVVKRLEKAILMNPNFATDLEELLKILTDPEFTRKLGGADNLASVYNKLMGRGLGTVLEGTGVSQLARTGKGSLEELLVAAQLLGLEKQASDKVSDLQVQMLGAIKSDANITEKATSAIGRLYEGSNLTGGQAVLVTTDLKFTFENKIGNRAANINIDVKSSNTDAYTRGLPFTGTIDEIYSNSDNAGLRDNLKAGWVAILSAANASEINNNYIARSQVLRIYGNLIMKMPDIVNRIAPDKIGKDKEIFTNTNFQHIIAINRRYFWYSKLIKTIADDLQNYNSSIYKEMMSFTNFGDLVSKISQYSKRLYQVKRSLVKRARFRGKTYEERLDTMLNELASEPGLGAELNKILSLYEKEVKSLSIKVLLKIKLK